MQTNERVSADGRVARPSKPGRPSARSAIHPVRAAEREIEHLHGVAEEGESPATPLIAIAAIALFVAAAFVAMLVVALGTTYLVTGELI